jgi:hypothetical protein
VLPMRRREEAGLEVAASRHPAGAQAEVRNRDSLESFVERLTTLGATLDEIDAIKGAWDTWDEGDPEYNRHDLVRLDDATLGRMMADVRAEHVSNTLTEEEQADKEYREAVAGHLNDAQNVVVNSTVDGVLEWVGEDRAKARAAYIAELTVPGHKARKGVVGGLRDAFGFEDGTMPEDDGGPS